MDGQIINTVFIITLILVTIATLIFLIVLILKVMGLIDNVNHQIDRNKDNIANTISNLNDITTVATAIALDVNEITSSINVKVQMLDSMLESANKSRRTTKSVKSAFGTVSSVIKFFKNLRK